MVGRLGVLVVAVASAAWPSSAAACSIKSLTPASFVSPAPNTYLGTNGAFLVTTRIGGAATVKDGVHDPVELEVTQTFQGLHLTDPSVAFFRPVRELLADTDYVVESEGGGLSVPFRTSAEALRIPVQLSLAAASASVPEQALSKGTCYLGPLQDRPFTRVADIRVTAAPKAHLLVSVTTLDSVSGELVEDIRVFRNAGTEAQIQLPLPEGVADCVRVRVFDFAGTLLDDYPSLCVVPEATAWSLVADVFEPRPAPLPGLPAEVPSGDAHGGEASALEAAGASRSSKGCQLARGVGAAGSWAGIFALGWLLRSRRRFPR